MHGAPNIYVGAPDNCGRAERAVLRFFFFFAFFARHLYEGRRIDLGNDKMYTLDDLYGMLSNLDNGISESHEKAMRRIKLPIPKEYGGGWATGSTQEDAVKHLIDRIRGCMRASTDVPSFRECWEKWIAIKEGQECSPCTIENYKRIANTRLIPFFGDKPIDQITADDIQLYFNSIMKLSRSYSTQSRALLRGVFGRAKRLGFINENPMQFDYKWSKKQQKKVVLQDNELFSVIFELEKLNGKDYLYACFLCFTSLRRGEILGLRWTDIDFENELIFVRNNIVYPDGVNDYVIKEPKDGSSGIVRLQSELSKRIEKYRRSKGYVIPYSEEDPDKPITRSMFTKMWNRIKKTLDLKGATSHCFRATYVTMMNAHCDHIDVKALQGALRHKTPDLAIRVYTKENNNKTLMAEKEYDEWLQSQLKQSS